MTRDTVADKCKAKTDPVQSLADQNKGGLLFGLAGAALGFVTGNPLLILAGLASGFVAGSVGIDRRNGAVNNLLGNRQTLGEIEPQPSQLVTLDGAQIAGQLSQPRDTLTNPLALHNVSYDAAFSEPNGASLAAPGGNQRTIRRHR